MRPLLRRAALPLAIAAALAGGAAAAEKADTRSIIQALQPPPQRPRPDVAPPEAAAPEAAASAASAPEPPPMASPAGPGAAPQSVVLDILFEPNSPQVKPESGALLGALVAALQSPELKGLRFVIEGPADARAAPAQRQRLAQQRADEVRLYLVALGVHPSRLKAVAQGPAGGRLRVVAQP